MRARPRRNRRTGNIRRLLQETALSPNHLVLPLFVTSGLRKEEIPSMSEVYRHPLNSLLQIAEQALSLGIPAVALFPAIEDHLKNKLASESANPERVVAAGDSAS